MCSDAETTVHAEPVLTKVTAHGEGDMAPSLADPLARLAGEADLVERLLSHIAEQRDKARAERERLERCLATMDAADRASSEVLIAAQAAAIKSRLTRLQVAASLAQEFALLRASEAASIKDELKRRDATTSGSDAAPDRDVVRIEADDPPQQRRFRRAS